MYVSIHLLPAFRYGDSADGKTVSSYVQQAVYCDLETGQEDPLKNGVCSICCAAQKLETG